MPADSEAAGRGQYDKSALPEQEQGAEWPWQGHKARLRQTPRAGCREQPLLQLLSCAVSDAA